MSEERQLQHGGREKNKKFKFSKHKSNKKFQQE